MVWWTSSSHGETRIIRKAYFEHPSYVPILQRAYKLWEELERESDERLFHRHHVVVASAQGGAASKVIDVGSANEMEGVRELSRQDFEAEFPSMVLPENWCAAVERDAGYLLVERCVKAHIRIAMRNGAEHLAGVEVTGFDVNDAGIVSVKTSSSQSFTASRLVVAAGAWSSHLLSRFNIGRLLTVRRKHLHWLAVADESTSAAAGFPIFFYETGGGSFYGFPKIDELGFKVSEHTSGEGVENPSALEQGVDAMDCARVDEFVSSMLKGVTTERLRHDVCMYTMTPDEHFIADTLPGHPNVAFAAGLSGHGFKQCNAIGEVLVDLVVDGVASLPVDFLRLSRFDLETESTINSGR